MSDTHQTGSATGTPGSYQATQDAVTEAKAEGWRLKEKGASLVGEAKQEAMNLAETAKQKARDLADEQRAAGADAIGNVAQAVHNAANELERQSPFVARYVHEAASSIDRFSDTIRHRSLDDMLGMVDDFARRNPALFFGGTVLAGFAVARFLRSSSDRRMQTRSLYRAGAAQSFGEARRSRAGQSSTAPGSTAGMTGFGTGASGTATGMPGSTSGVRSSGVASTRAGLGESAYSDRSGAAGVLGQSDESMSRTTASDRTAPDKDDPAKSRSSTTGSTIG